jgi:drug/metabolite transporter (DMT)-like permease
MGIMSVESLHEQARHEGAALPTARTIDPTRARGLALALLSGAAFGTSGVLAKSLLGAGWSPGAAVTARISIAALVLLLPALRALDGRWADLRRSAPLVVTYGLVAVAGCQVFYFNAVQTLSVGVALLLEYLGIVLVVVWLWARHGQRPQGWTVLGIVASVTGLVLVLEVASGLTVDVAGVLWGLGAAVGLAVYFVISADESTGLPPIVMAAGAMVVGAVALGLTGLVGILPMEASAVDGELAGATVPWFVPILGLGIVAGAFAYAVGIAATRQLGSKVASFMGLTEVLFAVGFAWLLLGESLSPSQLVGGLLIIAGVVAVQSESQDRSQAGSR